MIANYKNDETGEIVTAIYRDANCVQYRRQADGIVLTEAANIFDCTWTRTAEGEHSLSDRVRELEQEVADDFTTLQRLSELLTGVANALKGKPGPLRAHDWSDLPQRAADTMASLRALLARLDELTADHGVYEVGAGRAVALLEPVHNKKAPSDA